MIRLLRDAGGRLTFELRGSDDALLDADGDVEVTVTDGAGNQPIGGAVASRADVGQYYLDVTATEAAALDVYKVEWLATVSGDDKQFASVYEVVAAHVCERSAIRKIDQALDDTDKYPPAALDDQRSRAEDLFEEVAGYALRPKGARVSVKGSGRDLQLLPVWKPTKLISVAVDDGSGGPTDLTAEELAELRVQPFGAMLWPGHCWPEGAEISVYLEHGLEQTPGPVSAECAKLAAHYLKPSAIPDRAVSVSSSEDTFRLVTAAPDGPTGIQSVDTLLARIKLDVPAIG